MTRLSRVALACLSLALGGAFVAACGDDEKGSSSDKAPAGLPESTTTTESSGGGDRSRADPVVVTMKANKNMPEEIDVKVEQKIEWRNEDGYAHNVTSTSGENIASGNFTDSFDYAPKNAGTIDYVCTIHAGQSGKITVAK